MNYPVLTDLQLDMGGAQTDLVYPRGIPDVFRGSQVMLIGRYSNPTDLKSIEVKLTGKSVGLTRTYTYSNLNFPLRSETNDYLPRLWATRRVGWLMEQIRSNGEQKELRDEVTDLGTRYGIVTPYTSYLALEDERAITYSVGRQATQRQRDHRWSYDSQRAKSAPLPNMQPGVSVATGADAVQLSKIAREQQDVSRLKDEEKTSSVRRVAGKTFYLVDGVWTDSEFKKESKMPETVLAFGNDEYFALFKAEPETGKLLALGERVVVVFEGRVYRVNAPKGPNSYQVFCCAFGASL